jgi:predicted nucleic acid-binding protein
MNDKKDREVRHYYLIDASAVGRYFDEKIDPKTVKHNIAVNFGRGNIFYYIPQFCIAEIFNIFAKWHYREEPDRKRISTEKYRSNRNNFKKWIRRRKNMYAYDLHRYHNLNCDKVYKTEHTLPKIDKNKAHLSTFDILIIAMALDLQRIHGSDNLTILSCDERLIAVAKKLKIKTENCC